MPIFLIVIGLVFVISAVRGPSCQKISPYPCHQLLFYLLANDFTGQNNFIFWTLAIVVVGAIGYVPKLKPISDGFIILIILSLLLRKNGQGKSFIDSLMNQVSGTQTAKPAVSGGNTPNLATQSYFTGGGFGGTNIGISGPGVSIGVGSGGVSVGVGGGGTIGISGPGGTIRIGLPPIGGTGPGGIDPWGGGEDLGGYGPFGSL